MINVSLCLRNLMGRSNRDSRIGWGYNVEVPIENWLMTLALDSCDLTL